MKKPVHVLSDQLLRDLAASLSGELRHIRRELHQFPEVSESEFSTTKYLCKRIRDLGLEPTVGPQERGCFVDFGNSPPRVIIRGDIDALPIQTQLQTSYASRVDGVMHACGHDAHATMALGALHVLKLVDEGGALPERTGVRVVLQPAEETSTGALHMIGAGVLEGIESAIAVHVDPMRRVGTVGSRFGSFTAGCDTFIATISGDSGHSARPHLTGDSMAATAAWINDAMLRIPRCYDPRHPIVFSVGTIEGGTATNVVPASVKMTGTLRSVDRAGETAAREMLRQVSEAVKVRHNVEIALEFDSHTPALHNSPSVARYLREAAVQVVGAENVVDIDAVSMGAEDFAFFSEHVPSAMMRLGVANDEFNHPLHTPNFDIDESVLPIGAAILASTALKLCYDGAASGAMNGTTHGTPTP